MLFSAAIIIVGITLLIAMQFYRGVLSLSFPQIESRLLSSTVAAPESMADLLAAKQNALSKLHFSGPYWIANRYRPQNASSIVLQAAFCSKTESTAVWLAPPVNVNVPNQLLIYITSKLRDGRWAVTQVEDPYFQAMADTRTPAQTVVTADFPVLLAQHQQFVSQTQGEIESSELDPEDLLVFAGEWQRQIRDRLIRMGKLTLAGGIPRPGFRFGLSILWRILTRPHTKTDHQTLVPAARLVALSNAAEMTKDRAPSLSVQLWLMLISIFLSLAIGWPLLGLEFTLVIVGVIVFHEAGHWLAMRMFSYRNPHITLLPLLGGVAIGHERDPSAAKRAWVALAGPLPGIILGWTLLIVSIDGDSIGQSHGGLLALVLLVVNYLNILPIPPLDGSHVLRALLPLKWAKLQVLVVSLGIIAGVLFAMWTDFWVIGFLALTQLLVLRSIWRSATGAKRLAKDYPLTTHSHDHRLAWIFERMGAQFGKATAKARIDQAREVSSLLEMRPLGAIHRSVIATIFLALLAGPVLALAILVGISGDFDDVDYEQQFAQYQQRKAELKTTASRMAISELLAGFTEQPRPLIPAKADDLQTTEQLLDQQLPQQLRELYQLTNGIPELALSRVDELSSLTVHTRILEIISTYAWEDKVSFNIDRNDTPLVVPVSALESLWLLSDPMREDVLVLFDPNGSTLLRPYTVFQLTPETSAHTSIIAWLRSQWVDYQYGREIAALTAAAEKASFQSLQNAQLDELLNTFDRPAWYFRWFSPTLDWPVGASEIELAEMERRLGISLPLDYRRLLSRHNGFPPLAILPANAIHWVDEQQIAEFEQWLVEPYTYPYLNKSINVTRDVTFKCLAVGGWDIPAKAGQVTRYVISLIWCPQLGESGAYLRVHQQEAFADITALLRRHAAAMRID